MTHHQLVLQYENENTISDPVFRDAMRSWIFLSRHGNSSFLYHHNTIQRSQGKVWMVWNQRDKVKIINV